jgi:hypothetical protein
MRLVPLAAAVAAFLVPAAPALAAGDPTMPLWQVSAGMHCTGYSVIQGTAISSFNVDVLDVTGGEASVSTGQILIGVSGPAVDATGIGPGFSGSPIYCPDAAGTQRVIGAISQAVGEYGGKVALATPIEAIIGTPVDVPGNTSAAAKALAKQAKAARAKMSPRMQAAVALAKPLASPLTVSGLSAPLAQRLATASAKAGRPILSAPPGPLGSFPPQTLRPGSAVAVGYSTGDVRTSAVGTVTYVDGDKVWVFGHQLEAAGRRALLLQDAYIFRIINNPLGLTTGGIGATYKLGASGHDLGTVTSDGFSGVAGRTGPLPHLVPVQVTAQDQDAKTARTVNAAAADEAAVDLPSGGSWTSFIAPLAVSQAANAVLGATPGRLTGEMCAKIALAELKQPLRFCNRYISTSVSQGDDGSVGNAVLSGAANDLASALSSIDAYTGTPPIVTGVNVLLKVHRGADQAFMRSVSLPAHVRPGQRVKAKLSLRLLRGGTVSRSYTLRIPSDSKSGRQRVRLVGTDADQGDDGFTTIILGDDSNSNEGGDPGPANLDELADDVRATERYDGVTVRVGSRDKANAFVDDDFRISGQAETTVRVIR